MKNKWIFWMVAICLPFLAIGQNEIDSVLAQIEKNNTTLAALRMNFDADKIGNRTGIYLENPEVGLNYLWSDPVSLGNRTDINIRQSFDFPTAYGHRKQIADFRDSQTDLEYLKERKQILLEARLICLDLVYTNALVREYELRSAQSEDLAEAYQAMFDQGETGILELNKARLNHMDIRQKLETLKIEQSTYQKRLMAMNGGEAVNINITTIGESIIPQDFDQWYTQIEQSNPELLWMNREIQLSLQQEKLNRAMSLPKASAGYMGEYRSSEQLQGIMFGVSVPLWENKNTVKYAQLKTIAWQNISNDYKLQFYSQCKIHYEKALNLQNIVIEYRQSMGLYQNSELLKKAFDNGEISLLNYLMELTLTYNVIDSYLHTVNELNKSVALLYKYED